MRGMLFIAVLLIIAFVGAGCGTLLRNKEPVASEPVFADLPSTSETDNPELDRDKMQPGDVIVINFMRPGGQELPLTGKIREDGTVTLLSNKVFIAAGKTVRDFEREVSNQYDPKLFPPVTHPAPIEVEGEVKAPGRQPFTGPTTVLKAIQSAGGFTERANKRRVKLVRADGRACMVNCVKARTDPRQDLEVYPGDRVLVEFGRLW